MPRSLGSGLVVTALLISAATAAATSLPRSLAINSQFLVNAACERAAQRLSACQLSSVKALGPEGVQTSCCQPFNDLASLNCFCDGASKEGSRAALTQDAATIIQVSCDISSVPLTCPGSTAQDVAVQPRQPCKKLFNSVPQELAKAALPVSQAAATGNFLIDALGSRAVLDIPQTVQQAVQQTKQRIPLRLSQQQLQQVLTQPQPALTQPEQGTSQQQQQQMQASHQLTTARSMAGSSVTDALAFLAGAAKDATTLELDLDVDMERPVTRSGLPLATLIVGEQDGMIDAELDLEFDASEEDATKLLEVVSELMAGRASMQSLSAMLGSGDEVVRGVVGLLQTAGDRIQDLVTHNTPGLELDMSLDTSSVAEGKDAALKNPFSSLKSALITPRTTVLCSTDSSNPEACHFGSNPQQQQAATQQPAASSQASILAVTDLALQFAVVIALVGFLCASICAIVAHAQRQWRQQSAAAEDDRVPAGAIVVAANEKTPFLVHDGINYTPLPAFAAGKL